MPDLALDELSMLGITLDKLKLVAKSSSIKGYKSISEERLLRALNKPKLIKNSFDNERLKKIREDLNKSRHKLSKSEIKEIRKDLYEIESKKSISTQKIKKIQRSLSRFKEYYDYDDA